MATPEGKVKTDIKKWLDDRQFWRAGTARPEAGVRGWYYMPQNMGMGVSGIPDFVGSVTRRIERAGYASPAWSPAPFAIEAKAPGKHPTPIQLDRHAEMRAAGWLVLVVDDVSQLAELERYMS
jgi:hypothetical protein